MKTNPRIQQYFWVFQFLLLQSRCLLFLVSRISLWSEMYLTHDVVPRWSRGSCECHLPITGGVLLPSSRTDCWCPLICWVPILVGMDGIARSSTQLWDMLAQQWLCCGICCMTQLWILWLEQKSVLCLVPLIANFCEAAWWSRLDRAQEWEMLHYGVLSSVSVYFLLYAAVRHFLRDKIYNYSLCRPFKVEMLKLVCIIYYCCIN